MKRTNHHYSKPTFSKNGGLIPSQRMKDITRREMERHNRTHIPTRRDFRSPAEHIFDALKGIARTNVWPVIL